MKKFQMMMATVLVALMAFAVQSCGSDDKDDLSRSIFSRRVILLMKRLLHSRKNSLNLQQLHV